MGRIIHAICTYHRQWNPGDMRGWRSRDHRIHSSGDYKVPPPDDEHEELRHWVQEHLAGAPAYLQSSELPIVGSAFVYKLLKLTCTVHVTSCSPTHLHTLYETQVVDAADELGKAKQYSSYKLRHPSGQLWAEGAKIIRPRSGSHDQRAFEYILDHARKEGAWVWQHGIDPNPTRAMIDELIKNRKR